MEENWKFMGDQEKIYNELIKDGNLFIAGAAGTGKSELIKKYVKDMKNSGKNVIVTAPTGLAAQKIDGVTFHRAFSYSVGPKDLKGENSADVYHISSVLRNADIIIIDEVSMLRRDLFDLFFLQCVNVLKQRKADFDAGVVKEKRQLFIKIFGDFNQLPPVYTGKTGQLYKYDNKMITDIELMKMIYGKSFNDDFAFQSPYWDKLGLRYCKLDKIIRQQDEDLIKAIRLLKAGDERVLNWFNLNCKIISGVNFEENEYDKHVILCGTRPEVSEINSNYLDSLDSEIRTFIENIHYETDEDITITENDRIADPVVKLKVGARVQCLINEKSGAYKNGSLGTILSFGKDYAEVLLDIGKSVIVQVTRMPVNKYSVINGKTITEKVAEIEQIPLRLAKAMTVHKAQGQTFDYVIVKSDKFFKGQQYMVALSRCTSKEGLILWDDLSTNRISNAGKVYNVKLINKTVKSFYDSHTEIKDEVNL